MRGIVFTADGVEITDDLSVRAALGNVAEGAFDRGHKLQVDLGCGGSVSGSAVSRRSGVAEELLDELGHTDSDFHPGWVNNDAVDGRSEEMLSVRGGEGLPSRCSRCSAGDNPCEEAAR